MRLLCAFVFIFSALACDKTIHEVRQGPGNGADGGAVAGIQHEAR
jgi:hypothetical protein